MTSFSDEDTDKLIEMIRQHTALFNSQLDLCRDENVKDNIWKSIAKGLNKSDSECRKKWKLIKDSYNRYKRKQKCSTGSAAPAKNSKWQFFERLRFLENTPSQRESSTNIVDNDNTNSPTQAVDTEVDEQPSLVEDTHSREETSTQESSTPVNTNPDKPTKRITKRKKTDDEFLKLLRERDESKQLRLQAMTSGQHTFQASVDEISSFSKYIEMSLRKLSERSRSMAKSEIFNIISKYEIIDIDEGNSLRYYSSSLSNTTPYSPISVASPISEHQSQNDLSPLPRQFQDTSSGQFQNVLDNESQNDLSTPRHLQDIPREQFQNVLNDQSQINLSTPHQFQDMSSAQLQNDFNNL